MFAASRVLVIAGKGGVGKTTVGATIAVAAARGGADVLLVELEGYSNLARSFGRRELTYDEVELERPPGGGRIRARRITPDDALAEYLDASGLRPITNRLARSGAVDVVTAAAPGIRDLLALGKIRQLEQAAAADLIVVDAPASGHARTFLQAPVGLAGATKGGPIRAQADQALAMLTDGGRCQVVRVTTPEEGPVSETVETAYALEDEVGVHLGPVVVNGRWPALDGLDEAVARAGSGRGRPLGPPGAVDAARFRLANQARQGVEVARLEQELPLPLIELPYLFTVDIGRAELDLLADALLAGDAPGPADRGSARSGAA